MIKFSKSVNVTVKYQQVQVTVESDFLGMQALAHSDIDQDQESILLRVKVGYDG